MICTFCIQIIKHMWHLPKRLRGNVFWHQKCWLQLLSLGFFNIIVSVRIHTSPVYTPSDITHSVRRTLCLKWLMASSPWWSLSHYTAHHNLWIIPSYSFREGLCLRLSCHDVTLPVIIASHIPGGRCLYSDRCTRLRGICMLWHMKWLMFGYRRSWGHVRVV